MTEIAAPTGRRAGQRPEAAAKAESPFRRIASDFVESRLAVAGLVVLLLIVFVLAVFAPWIAPQDPYDLTQIDILDSKMPPGGGALGRRP